MLIEVRIQVQHRCKKGTLAFSSFDTSMDVNKEHLKESCSLLAANGALKILQNLKEATEE